MEENASSSLSSIYYFLFPYYTKLFKAKESRWLLKVSSVVGKKLYRKIQGLISKQLGKLHEIIKELIILKCWV